MKLFLITTLVLFIGCREGSIGPQGSPGNSTMGKRGPTGKTGPSGSPGLAGSPGLDGANGLNSLVDLERVEEGLEECASDKGVLFYVGLDTNKNEVLDEEEVKGTSFVCDGGTVEIDRPEYVVIYLCLFRKFKKCLIKD